MSYQFPVPNNIRFLFPFVQREIWARSNVLSAASPYFKTLFGAGFSEESKSNHASKEMSSLEERSTSCTFEDSDDETDDNLNLTLAFPPARSSTSTIPTPFHQVIIKEVSYTTYLAVLNWITTQHIEFAPLVSTCTVTSSDPESSSSSRISSLLSHSTQYPLLPALASPKSVFRLAHFLDLPLLQEMALSSLESQLSPTNVIHELVGDITRHLHPTSTPPPPSPIRNPTSVSTSILSPSSPSPSPSPNTSTSPPRYWTSSLDYEEIASLQEKFSDRIIKIEGAGASGIARLLSSVGGRELGAQFEGNLKAWKGLTEFEQGEALRLALKGYTTEAGSSNEGVGNEGADGYWIQRLANSIPSGSTTVSTWFTSRSQRSHRMQETTQDNTPERLLARSSVAEIHSATSSHSHDSTGSAQASLNHEAPWITLIPWHRSSTAASLDPLPLATSTLFPSTSSSSFPPSTPNSPSQSSASQTPQDDPVHDVDSSSALVFMGVTFETAKRDAVIKSGSDIKLGQLLRRLARNLVEQSTWSHTWGVHIAGEGMDAALFLVVMDHEGIQYARLDKCWTLGMGGVVVSLLRSLASASLSALGCSPFVIYDDHLRPVAIDLGSLPIFKPSACSLPRFYNPHPSPINDDSFSAAHLEYPPPPLLLLHPDPISPNHAHSDFTPFHRGTIVFNATLELAPLVLAANFVESESPPPSPPASTYVVKFSHVQDSRACRESLALDLLGSANVPQVPELVYAFSARRLTSQIALPLPPNVACRIVQRHLSIIVTRFEAPCTLLMDASLTFQEMALALVDVLVVLKASVRAGIIHRDISAGNLLFCSGKVILNDWDCAKILREDEMFDLTEGEGQGKEGRTGTLDMAAIAVLQFGAEEEFQHLPHHDLESVVYFFWFFLALRIPNLVPPSVKLYFGVQASKDATLLSRMGLWGDRGSDAKEGAVQNLARNGMIGIIRVITALADLHDEIVVSGSAKKTTPQLRWDTGLGKMVPYARVIPDYDATVDAMVAIFRKAASEEQPEPEKEGMRTFWRNPS